MILKYLDIEIVKAISLSFILTFYVSCTRRESNAEVQTTGVYDIKGTSVLAKGEITDLGDGILEYGFCWDHSAMPTIDHVKKSLGPVAKTGPFISVLQDLQPVTKYYIRAYVTDSYGTNYGNVILFSTIFDYETDTLIDIDGNAYPTVKIDTLWWMAENLKVTKFNDGTDIPSVPDNRNWFTTEMPAYCCLYNDYSYKEVYGLLYNWYAVNTGKLCPAGWHVSTLSEWDAMDIFLGSSAGDKLKETGTEHWPVYNKEATNAIGFTALPGGYRDGNSGYFTAFYEGYWWSSTGYLSTGAWSLYISYEDRYIFGLPGASKKNGYSVRCVKDH